MLSIATTTFLPLGYSILSADETRAENNRHISLFEQRETTPLSAIPEDSTLRHHFVTQLRAEIIDSHPNRPADSTLFRHYDALINAELEDPIIRLTSTKGQNCPIPLRRIRFIRQEDQKDIILISNDLDSPAQELMDLYKQRWQIELFFEWVKQNLKIKCFFAATVHAVQLQVLIAI
ncbi:transposase [Methylomarinum roseum]|uniref:transposase n=1 Tax=Methylomarinum roseum TaxID=3067653 RepID=UPI003D7CCC08